MNKKEISRPSRKTKNVPEQISEVELHYDVFLWLTGSIKIKSIKKPK